MADRALQPADAASRRAAPTRIIGRQFDIARVAMKLARHQFVTIVGPGGMGKSAVARAYANEVRAAFPGGVFIVNVSGLASSEMLPAAVMAMLGIPVKESDPMLSASAFLARKQALIVLDGCEHLLAATAAAAERLCAASDGVSILATSREALMAQGEWVYRLPPMTLAGDQSVSTLEEALTFTAVQLFVDRARHADPDLRFTDAQAQALCDVCSCLDGIPLAIELAAARVAYLGLDGLAEQIGDRLGWRDDDAHSPEPRHRTLSETLDWSHDLLSDLERTLLRRLSIFRGAFDAQAAQCVAGDEQLGAQQIVEGIAGLLAKSLLVYIDAAADSGSRYRLLDTTRDYAARKLQASGDADAVARRHARFLRSILDDSIAQWETLQPTIWLRTFSPWLEDVRRAVDRCLRLGDDPATVVALATGGMAIARELGAELDFKPRLEAAWRLLQGLAPRQPLLEIQVTRSRSGMTYLPRAYEHAQFEELRRALECEDQGPPVPRAATVASGIALMTGFFGAAGLSGDYPRMNEWAGRIEELARRTGDPMALLSADRIRAQVLHWGGAHAMANRVARRVLEGNVFRIPFAYNPSPIELRVSMRIVLARSLWIQGFAGRAAQVIAEAMRRALHDSPQSRCQVVALGALPIALWNGEFAQAQDLAELLMERATQCSVGQWDLWAREFAAVAAHRRHPSGAAGAPVLPAALHDHHLTDHLCTMLPDRVTDAQVERVLTGSAGWCAPEVLRAHATTLLHGDAGGRLRDSAETLLRQALGKAKAQGALVWELRSAVSLGRLLKSTGRATEAHALLGAILGRFKEQSQTVDVMEARAMLEGTS